MARRARMSQKVTLPHGNGGGAGPDDGALETGSGRSSDPDSDRTSAIWRCRVFTLTRFQPHKIDLAGGFIQEGGGSSTNTEVERSGLEGMQRYRDSTTVRRDQRNKEANEIAKGFKASRIQGNRKQRPSRDACASSTPNPTSTTIRHPTRRLSEARAAVHRLSARPFHPCKLSHSPGSLFG